MRARMGGTLPFVRCRANCQHFALISEMHVDNLGMSFTSGPSETL